MKKILFVLALCGLAFSGYLGGTKLFSGTCAFNETCPYFLGYPACFFGFLMFLVITTSAGILLFGSEKKKSASLATLLTTSLLGILFAGYYTLGELPTLFHEGLSAYFLVLPTCAMGLIMYILIFTMTMYIQKHSTDIEDFE